MLARRLSYDMSPTKTSNSVRNNADSSDDESTVPVQRNKKRVQRFSDSDTDKENVEHNDRDTIQDDTLSNNSEPELSSTNSPKIDISKSRIKMGGSNSDSDTSTQFETVKNEEQQMRMKNKRNKLKDKFKGLLSSRGKHALAKGDSDKQSSEGSHSEKSDLSDNEMSSIAKIKQKIKKSMALVSSICDPDTSDEEGNMNKKETPKPRKRKEQKSIKMTEAKPVRMSAKQAMENMQLIKSESNRMLREKTVSLPYHRPKALALKDIMSRRKPAVSSDGKALPIKMNEEQLKHYAQLLEQRQKEMMELCKSESDEETSETEEIGEINKEPPQTENIRDINKETPEDELKLGINKEAERLLETTNNIENEIMIEKSSNTVEHMENEKMDTNMYVVNEVSADPETIENNSVETDSTEVGTINNEGVNSERVIKSSDIDTNVEQEKTEKNDSNSDLKLVYNDSVEEEQVSVENTENDIQDTIEKNITENVEHFEINSEQNSAINVGTEPESQLISLHYTESNSEGVKTTGEPEVSCDNKVEDIGTALEDKQDDFFSDDDVNMDDIDRLIENSEIMKDDDNINSAMLIRESQANAKPKLMGAPGMVIDLDGGAIMPKKLTGVELLKERFIYFSKLKTPEDMEREKEKRLKPGAQHLKLKQDLEEQIAEQRSLEWAKRLEEEKQQHMEMETILDDAEDSFEKIEAKLEEDDVKEGESSSESEEEELEENDIDIKDKSRKHNPMVDEEAEESECDEGETEATDEIPTEDIDDDNVDEEDDEEDESSDSDSSESEQEETSKLKKGRILKAFVDSDDEDATVKPDESEIKSKENNETNHVDDVVIPNEVQESSQDDIIQLAQRHASASDDLFTSQESSTVIEKNKDRNSTSDEVLGTQTFSILDSTTGLNIDSEFKSPGKLDALCMSQPYHDPNLNVMVNGSQLPITQTSQSQPIGEDILALCTGKFYDNEFVSPTDEHQYVDSMSQDLIINNNFNRTQPVASAIIDSISKDENDGVPEKQVENIVENKKSDENGIKPNADGNLLKSILDELYDPEFGKPKPNRFFTGGNTQKKETDVPESSQMKKKFIIDSDDETPETVLEVEQGKKKKLKKKKPEKRALQISDDEEEEVLEQEDDYMSDLEDTERLVEYDSEENEIEVKPDKPKKKRKVTDFFEQEAELTSEDEWVGSGDEDEKGLDRMEREAGDDEVFHQGKLRRELGQIHMRDVLDQDKREVRIIQELLFEDGDLGGGGRQRKFRWRNAGEDDENGTMPNEFADTQEEEFESEEQWRKQRHERDVFLRQMHQDEEDASLNVSVNRTTIIKANLLSKSMSTLLQEVNQSKTEKSESPVVQEKKTAKDIPSPQKSFSIFQQNYHGSLLTRGRGALARLAALATPLAVDDDDAPKIGSLHQAHKRNFVFAALTPNDDVPKVTIKRKADANLGTPKLVKKMKIEEKQTRPNSSLLDHLKL